MGNQDWIIREAVGDDLPFIYSSWAKSYCYNSPIGKSCANSTCFWGMNRIIDHILKQPDTRVIVAVNPLIPNVLYGYVVFQPGILHYAFTKEAFERWGIASSLIHHAGMPSIYTFKTFMVKSIMIKHPEMEFNPFLLFKGAHLNGQGNESLS